MRAGFVSLVGRPNAGKSTLLNRLAGLRLSIVSPRPQTTRNRITGIRNTPGAQVIFVDTPGLTTEAGPLGTYMRDAVVRAVEDVDLVCAVVDATAREQPDPALVRLLAPVSIPVFCLLNKVDRVVPRTRILPVIDAWRTARSFQEILPVSGLRGTSCDRLLGLLVAALPEHPAYFPDDATTDQPETFYVAEVVRGQVFRLTREEVPYAVAVRVEELSERRRPPCLRIRATVFVERASQRGILIGQGGGMLKRIGTEARRELEAFFGIQVYLGLTVEVRERWRSNERALRELGFRRTS